MAETQSNDFFLTGVRLSFPKLFKAEEFKSGDGRPRYSANFLVEPGSAADKLIGEKIAAAFAREFKDADKAKQAREDWEGQKNQWAYLKGKGDMSGYRILSCHRRSQDGKPLIINKDRSPLEENSGLPYSGCVVNAKVSLYVQTGENPGLRASFSGVQFWADGERLSGTSTAEAEEFPTCGAEDAGSDMI